jgi:hypothetical protein
MCVSWSQDKTDAALLILVISNSLVVSGASVATVFTSGLLAYAKISNSDQSTQGGRGFSNDAGMMRKDGE